MFSGVQSAMLAESHTRACIRQRAFLGQEKINRLKEKIKKSPIVKNGEWVNGDTLHVQAASAQELSHGGSRIQGSQLFAPAHRTL